MERIVIPVSGMHCKSCELMLETALREVQGVAKVRASTRKGNVMIYTQGITDIHAVHSAIRSAGYAVGKKNARPLLTSSVEEYGLLLVATIIVFAFAAIVQRIDVSSWAFNQNATGLATSLLLGLTAGVSTCMALVGGLVLAVAAKHAEKHPESTAVEKFRPHLYFNTGRVVGFAFFGGLLGLVGSIIAPSSIVLGVFMIVVALLMLFMGFQITGISPALSDLRLTLPAGIARALGIHRRHEREYSHGRSLTLGALTFFLPCGFTQLVQMSAVTSGGFVQGALLMSAFALGTAPGLLGIGGIASITRGMFGRVFFKIAGVAVILLAVVNLRGGINLTGFVMPQWPDADVSETRMVNGVQEVHMEQYASGYRPASLTIKRGIPVRWIINSTASRSCASSIVIPALGISRALSPGNNVIEFTPRSTGPLLFTCSMGMYSGAFMVTE